MSESHGLEVYSNHSRHLSISRRFAEIAPAPILRLHRHQDGYIAFAAVRDGVDFRPLVSIRARELETWFPAFREQLEKDSYVSINADWRLRKHGLNGDAYGYPLHRSDRLRYINACYVDIDFHKLSLDLGTVIGRLVNLQESGQLPHASMLVRSGHGLWLLWLVCDIGDSDLSQRAFPEKFDLYSRIQAAIIERLLPLGADMAARDAARHLRIPGSLNVGSETTVEWLIQGANDSGYIYTLPQLAGLFNAVPTKRHRGEIVAHNPAKRRGWVALNARRLRDFNTLRSLRGGFCEGCRNNAAKIYAWLLRTNAVPPDDVRGLVAAMAAQCRPRLDSAAVKDAVKYSKRMQRMRDQVIADWLGISVTESEVLEGFPPAVTFRTANSSTRPPRPRELKDASIQDRRAMVRAVIQERGNVPSVRQMSRIIADRGVNGNPKTISTDYRAMGITSEWSRRIRSQPKPEPPGPQLSFPVCNVHYTPESVAPPGVS
jgi:hypothetical protein